MLKRMWCWRDDCQISDLVALWIAHTGSEPQVLGSTPGHSRFWKPIYKCKCDMLYVRTKGVCVEADVMLESWLSNKWFDGLVVNTQGWWARGLEFNSRQFQILKINIRCKCDMLYVWTKGVCVKAHVMLEGHLSNKWLAGAVVSTHGLWTRGLEFNSWPFYFLGTIIRYLNGPQCTGCAQPKALSVFWSPQTAYDWIWPRYGLKFHC